MFRSPIVAADRIFLMLLGGLAVSCLRPLTGLKSRVCAAFARKGLGGSAGLVATSIVRSSRRTVLACGLPHLGRL